MKSSKSILPKIIPLLILFITLITCKKEECNDNCVNVTIDQYADMVGYLDPRQPENELMGLLYYAPGYLEAVILEMGAVEVDPGFYQITMPLLNGLEEEVLFQVHETPEPAAFATNSGFGELRVPYKVYKNAECSHVNDAYSDTLGYNATLDKYIIRVYYKAHGECVPGEGFCLAVEQIFGQVRYYDDSGYTLLTETEDIKLHICDP